MLEDDDFKATLPSGKQFKGAPAQAIVKSLVIRAIEGDVRAFDLLAKHGYGTRLDINNTSIDFGAGTSQFVKNASAR